jgi:hypothetical protein
MSDNAIQSIILSIIPLLLGITLHEAAHGWAAKRFGDNTAFMLGRITLNPLKHIDPIGTVIMPIALWVISGGTFTFGYAKPVPVNFNNLNNPKRDMVWVAFAGPAVNLIQAFIWGLIAIMAGSTSDWRAAWGNLPSACAEQGCGSMCCSSYSICCPCRRSMAAASPSGCCHASNRICSPVSSLMAFTSCWHFWSPTSSTRCGSNPWAA